MRNAAERSDDPLALLLPVHSVALVLVADWLDIMRLSLDFTKHWVEAELSFHFPDAPQSGPLGPHLLPAPCVDRLVEDGSSPDSLGTSFDEMCQILGLQAVVTPLP